MAGRIAILIDAENVRREAAREALKRVSDYGDAIIRRAYGDFSDPKLEAWKDLLPRYALVPRTPAGGSGGHNGADIALVIDAMDILHSQQVDAFCLVSSDSDFAGLAIRLRESGAMVIGFGETKAPERFRRACMEFVELSPSATREGAEARRQPTGTQTAKSASPLPEEICEFIVGVVKSIGGTTGVSLQVLGIALLKRRSEFRPQDYGSASLHKLLRRIGSLTVQGTGSSMRVSLKSRQKAA